MKMETFEELKTALENSHIIRAVTKGDHPSQYNLYLLHEGNLFWETGYPDNTWARSFMENVEELYTRCSCYFHQEDQHVAKRF